MAAGQISLQSLRRHYELEPRECVAQLREGLEDGTYKPENFSVRNLFEALVPNGREVLYEMSFRRSGGRRTQWASLLEAGGAMMTQDFSDITGQIIYNKVRDAYNDPELLWPQLCTTVPTEFLDGERIPGIGRIGDKAETVGEAAEYPLVGLNQEWTDTKATVKRGFIVPLTREVIIADRTGVLLKWAAEGGRWAGVKKEKEVLDVAVGVTNNYNRNGVSSNTYLLSGAYINDQTGNALKGSGNEWLALESADLLFDAMTDPNTGEPIGIPKNPKLLVPSALLRTAERIVTATSVQTVDMRANATTIRTDGPNPYANRRPQVLSNQYVKNRSSSTTKWYYGDFQGAILYMEVWGLEVLQAANNSEPEFTQDIWQRHKVSYRGLAQMYEPRFVCRNDT